MKKRNFFFLFTLIWELGRAAAAILQEPGDDGGWAGDFKTLEATHSIELCVISPSAQQTLSTLLMRI
jgi:hypothetical protein